MVYIDVGIDVESAISEILADIGYREGIDAIIEDLRFEFYALLADDLRAGLSDWPVDTGLSEASFYAEEDGLYNHAPYAIYVENNTGAVQEYVSANVVDLVERALDAVGLSSIAPAPVDDGDRFAEERRGLLSRLGELGRSSRQLFRGFARFNNPGRLGRNRFG